MTDGSKYIDLSGNDVAVNSILTNDGGILSRVQFGNGVAPTSVTTTTTTITAAILLGGVIVNAAATAVTATFDTAALVVAAVNAAYPGSGAKIGDTFAIEVINGGSSSGAITVGAGTGGTFDTNVATANKTVAINAAKTVFVRLTNVTIGSEAYVIYM